MKRILVCILILAGLASPAAGQVITAKRADAVNAGAAKFDEVLGKALKFLGGAETYVLDVQSEWKASGDAPGQQGQSTYRLLADKAGRHRVEVRASTAAEPQLVYVNDGKQATTLLAAQGLYSQHAAGSPQASLESNTMLALSLAGSGIDVLLQPNVSQYVQTQATDIRYLGEKSLGKEKTHHFEIWWAGAKVELWFATGSEPLLRQFTRIATVPTGDNECYEMVHTARFAWKLGARLPADAFVVALPEGARRVTDIYDTLSGDDPSARVGKPLPKIQLTTLDGGAVDVAVPQGKRGMVLIFWATWCTPSVEEMPAVSQFVKQYLSKGVGFYAVNVGEEPGDVRRFTAKSPLVSAVMLDPQGRASSTLRVTQMPAAVVINADNTVRAILMGPAEQVQADVAKELDQLLAEPAPVTSTARRPR